MAYLEPDGTGENDDGKAGRPLDEGGVDGAQHGGELYGIVHASFWKREKVLRDFK